jgi:hypothetical protein
MREIPTDTVRCVHCAYYIAAVAAWRMQFLLWFTITLQLCDCKSQLRTLLQLQYCSRIKCRWCKNNKEIFWIKYKVVKWPLFNANESENRMLWKTAARCFTWSKNLGMICTKTNILWWTINFGSENATNRLRQWALHLIRSGLSAMVRTITKTQDRT